MKVLLFCSAFPPLGRGGGPVASELIARGFKDSGHDVTIATPGSMADFQSSKEYKIFALGSPNVYYDYWVQNGPIKKVIWHFLENFNPRAFARASKIIMAVEPHVICTVSLENLTPATWLAAYLSKKPLVHFAQSYFALCWKGSMFKRGARCRGRCRSCAAATIGRKAFSKLVDILVAESEFLLERHRKCGYFRNADFVKIPGALDPQVFKSKSSSVANSKIFGFFGNLSTEKGFKLVIEVAKMCLDAEIDAHFLIAGRNEKSTRLDFKAKDLPNCIFEGWQDPNDFYPRIGTMLVPSMWDEPFGRVAVEPLCFSVPIIAARVGALPEIVIDGISGLTFKAGDPYDMFKCVRRLVDEPELHERLSEGAFRSSERYTYQHFTSQIHKLAARAGAG